MPHPLPIHHLSRFLDPDSDAFLDAHCHLADPRLQEALPSMLARARQSGIVGFLQGGIGPEDWARQHQLAREEEGIFPCFGLHPWWVASQNEETCSQDLKALETRLDQSIGLGELGLDYGPRLDPDSHTRQRHYFKAQLTLAQAYEKPLVLHIVRAHDDALRLLANAGPWPQGGIVHAFTGAWPIAQRYLKLGLCLSVGAPVVREGYKKLKYAIAQIPPDRLVLETDSPDQSPPSHRGQHNEPSTLWQVAEAVATLTNSTKKSVLRRSSQTLIRIFGKEMQSTLADQKTQSGA